MGELSYSVKLCETGITMPGMVQPRKPVDGMTVYLCECTSQAASNGQCLGGFSNCREGYELRLCERGLVCDAPTAEPVWSVTARWSDDKVAGDISWTNPNLGCALVRVQLWLAIPVQGDVGNCTPGVATPTCDWVQLHDRSAGGACAAACKLYPDGYRGGELDCGTDAVTEACREGLGLISGIEEEVHIDQRLAPGASFWLFGQLANGNWIVLGTTPYQSNGTDGGTFTAVVGDDVTVDRGNLGTSLDPAKVADWTTQTAGAWGHVLKLGCGPVDRQGSNDEYGSDTVCDGGAELWVLPVAPSQVIE